MILIIGLGNPGDKYLKSRHNAGWLLVDYLQSQHADFFSNWKMSKRLESEMSEAKIEREEYTLAKPQTFMNESGRAVKKIALMNNLKNLEDLIVAHDDIDLNFGKYKIQSNRGTAGHNGVISIVEHMKTQAFTRVRIGIYPEHIDKKNLDTTKFVLQPFAKTELKTLYAEIFPEIVKNLIEL